MHLLLMRHGQTHSNVSGALDTEHPGADLTDLGLAQAVAAAKALETREIEAIYVSPLARTQQTAVPHNKEMTVLPGLREISAGDVEMKADDDSRHTYLHTVASWLFGEYDVRMPGGETGHEFLQRWDDAIAAITDKQHTTVLVIAHGAAIRTWVGNRVEDDDRWAEQAFQSLGNTGLIELEDTADGWRIVAWENHPIGGDYLEDPTAPDPTSRPPE